PSAHADVLDELGALGERTIWNDAYGRWRAVEQRIVAASARSDRLREQRDLLAYQRRELESARLQGDELEGLRARVARAEGGARLLASTQAALASLDGDPGAASALADALHQ